MAEPVVFRQLHSWVDRLEQAEENEDGADRKLCLAKLRGLLVTVETGGTWHG